MVFIHRHAYKKNNKSKQQKGLTLIELMVAIALGLLLTAGVLELFLSSSQSFSKLEEVVRMNENSRFAIDYLAREIREADHWGCISSLDQLNNRLNVTDEELYGFTAGIEGKNNGTDAGGVPNPDTLTLRGAVPIGAGLEVIAPYPTSVTEELTVPTGNGLKGGDILMVANCDGGDIFQLTNGDASTSGKIAHEANSGTPGNTSANLFEAYGNNAFVYKTYSKTFSLRTGRNGQLALFETSREFPEGRELIENVENMKVLFGEDTSADGSANRYVTADQVTDMNNVVSIRLKLLMTTGKDNIVPVTQEIEFDGATIKPNDKRMRRAYTTTVVLRNRM